MKALEDMTRSELQRAYEKTNAAHSAANRALIAAGRGQETGRETLAKTDPLSLHFKETWDAFFAVVAEQKRRMAWHGSHHRIIKKDC